jgi:hypothetical protein
MGGSLTFGRRRWRFACTRMALCTCSRQLVQAWTDVSLRISRSST